MKFRGHRRVGEPRQKCIRPLLLQTVESEARADLGVEVDLHDICSGSTTNRHDVM